MGTMRTILAAMAAAAIAGCEPSAGRRADALDASAWKASEWISAADAPVYDGKVYDGVRVADGTSWFVRDIVNEGAIERATWMTTALGVYEIYVNGKAIGDDFLKPGFTHVKKTRRSFTYDVTDAIRRGAGESNTFAAEVSHGWWSDKIVTPNRPAGGFFGKKPAFRGVLEIVYADGTRKLFGTDTKSWKAGVAGPVTHASIFDGEEADGRLAPGYASSASFKAPEVNREFSGEILPTDGAEVCLRRDIALRPVRAYTWKGVTGETKDAFGKVKVVREFAEGEEISLNPGETLVVDFGQNAAAVPAFLFKADEGTVLTALPAEMLNDNGGLKSRGNDGPEGSTYRVNLRHGYDNGRLVKYTFGKCCEYAAYHPRFTFFGYRYVSVTATGAVKIRAIASLPVTSIRKDLEIGCIETGDKDVNRLISNVYWGQLSNYLSVPTDCPQRNERLGWTADTQVFSEAGTFNADTSGFFRKWMRDMRDTQHEKGGFPGVAPFAQYGNSYMRLGWADAGVIVSYRIFMQFGDRSIVDANWSAMELFMARMAETKYRTENLPECGNYQWNDWLSLTKFESCPYKPEYSAFEKGPDGKSRPKADALLYWNYLGGCYWVMDSRMMADMAVATGRGADAAKYRKMAADAEDYMKKTFFSESDGMVVKALRGMQTPALFALRLGLVDGAARSKTIADLKASFKAGGGTFHTGFLGTSIMMDTLTENGMADVAYSLLLNHSFPGWLYSVDQGATTIWERWNSYTLDKGFGPVGMNSFNHYAYGAVLAWIYKTAAGIASDPKAPGFKNIIMKPIPDRRLGHVKAEYRSAAGLIKSEWHYEGSKWIWKFTIPEGSTASVTLPHENFSKQYAAGDHVIEMEVF